MDNAITIKATSGYIVSWCRTHKKLTCLIIAIIAIVVLLIGSMAAPTEAHAVVPALVGIGIAAIIGVVGGVTTGAAIEGLSEGAESIIDAVFMGFASFFRQMANGLFELEAQVLNDLRGADILTRPFETLLDTQVIYDVLKSIWNNVSVPLGIVLILVFFVVGLYNIFKTVGQNDAGVDIWQIFVCYFLLAFGIVLIQNSWALFEGVYDLTVSVIESINYVVDNDVGATFEAASVSDDVTDAGSAGFIFLMALVGFVAAIVVYFISYACMTLRGIQLYIYTVAAPIPLAFLVSESSRSMGTGFLKRYLSVLISGIIIVLLVIIMGLWLGNAPLFGEEINADSSDSYLTFIFNHLMALVFPLVIAWAMLKSGQWAKELVGIGI